jgi:hypothetical protein
MRDEMQRRKAAFDDIPTCVGWYTKPAAWIKKYTLFRVCIFLAPPAGLVQRKQSRIVFSNGVTQSASGQSRAGAGDRTRHTTVTGENLRQFARQPVLPNFPRGGKLRRNAKGVSSRQSDFVGTVCRAMVVAGSCRRGKRKDHRCGWSFRFGVTGQNYNSAF